MNRVGDLVYVKKNGTKPGLKCIHGNRSIFTAGRRVSCVVLGLVDIFESSPEGGHMKAFYRYIETMVQRIFLKKY